MGGHRLFLSTPPAPSPPNGFDNAGDYVWIPSPSPHGMRYISTRGGIDAIPFKQAVMMGLARDGGLLLPEAFPHVSDRLDAWSKLDYPDLAFEIFRLYADDIPADTLRRIIRASYDTFRDPRVTPVVAVGPNHVLELFHGPTLAFKDVALQFLGNLFEHILDETGSTLNIVVATSGDTGSAAIHGIRGRAHMRIFVLHPDGRVSPVQALQMTSVTDANVFNIALDGTFDDAQAIVKQLFSDLPFKDAHHLGAVNSINWARVLAQVVYYFHAAFQVRARTGIGPVSFSVPTGNFGDIFAGHVAAQMGLPISRLVLATNENDILSRFFSTGTYQTGTVRPTLSPSMDIQIASNFERWLFLKSGRDAATLKTWMNTFATSGSLTLATPETASALDPWIRAGRADTQQTLDTIAALHRDFDYLIDPHTAVGVAVAAAHHESNVPMICLATAHPAKFPEAIGRATGHPEMATAPEIENLRGRPTRMTRLPNRTAAVADYIVKHLD